MTKIMRHAEESRLQSEPLTPLARIDASSLKLNSAIAILHLVESQFECPDEGPSCINEHIYAALSTALNFVIEAKALVDSMNPSAIAESGPPS